MPPDPRSARFDNAYARWQAALQAGDERRAGLELVLMRECLRFRWLDQCRHDEAMQTLAAAEKRHRGTWPPAPLVPADEARGSLWHA